MATVRCLKVKGPGKKEEELFNNQEISKVCLKVFCCSHPVVSWPRWPASQSTSSGTTPCCRTRSGRNERTCQKGLEFPTPPRPKFAMTQTIKISKATYVIFCWMLLRRVIVLFVVPLTRLRFKTKRTVLYLLSVYNICIMSNQWHQ